MSSIDSRPTDEAHEARVDAGRGLLFLGQLAVSRGRRLDHQAAHVADVGDMAVQFERLDEPRAGVAPTLDDERR